MMEGLNSSVIYCKNFSKCHNVPTAQQLKKPFSSILHPQEDRNCSKLDQTEVTVKEMKVRHKSDLHVE
jgi:hypothetical protein